MADYNPKTWLGTRRLMRKMHPSALALLREVSIGQLFPPDKLSQAARIGKIIGG